MDPISTSSSDDVSVLREIDEYFDESPPRDAATSSSFSFPPLWQSTSSGNLGVNGGPSHGVSSPKWPFTSDERILFQAALKDLNETTAEIDVPEGILSVSLLRHQKIELAWLIEKEKRGHACMGGFLAVDQGLGKTVSMIALIQMERSSQDKHKSEAASIIKPEALNLEDDEDIIVANAPTEVKPTVEIDDIEEILKASGSNRKPAAGTLVICPVSVLRQWARELDEKVTEEAKLSVLMHHGSNRTRDPVELAKYDVVLTTYSIASMEVPKQLLVDEDNDQNLEEKYGLSSEFSVSKKHKKTSGNRKGKGTHSDASDCGALAKVRWFRIILDEAQTIKNHRTQVARACCSLRAKRRWCLSGTPIQNAIDDLFSYFRFLRHNPYSNYKKFVVGIRSAISRNSNHGYMRLQCILKGIMLRLTKGNPTIELPSVNVPKKKRTTKKTPVTAEVENQPLSTVLVPFLGDKGKRKLTLDEEAELQRKKKKKTSSTELLSMSRFQESRIRPENAPDFDCMVDYCLSNCDGALKQSISDHVSQMTQEVTRLKKELEKTSSILKKKEVEIKRFQELEKRAVANLKETQAELKRLRKLKRSLLPIKEKFFKP